MFFGRARVQACSKGRRDFSRSQRARFRGNMISRKVESPAACSTITVRGTRTARRTWRTAEKRAERATHASERAHTNTPLPSKFHRGPHQDLSAPKLPTQQHHSVLTEQRSAPEAQHSHTGAGQGGGCCLGGLDRCRVSGATSRRVTASPPCAMYANGRQRLAAMKQGGRWRRGGAVGRWAAARAATVMHERHGSAMKKAGSALGVHQKPSRKDQKSDFNIFPKVDFAARLC